MSIETTYTDARAHFAELLDKVADDREVVIIKRRGCEDVAMIAADELRSLEETVYLLRSPENARRLLAALERARAGKGTPQTIDEIRLAFGLVEEK
jgi:antitoxin YefM